MTGDVGETIITVGDQDRVKAVSQHFDSIDVVKGHREFLTHTGKLNGHAISVISTGIGTDNIDIVFTELDALFNIDFETRTIKDVLTTLDFIRIGTSGTLQEDIPVDSILLSSHGLGFDGLLDYYNCDFGSTTKGLEMDIINAMALPTTRIRPVLAPGDRDLIEEFRTDETFTGITATCSGFYGPQGRIIRLQPRIKNFLDILASVDVDGHRITNFEMETAGIYGMAKLLGHRAVSVNTIIANRPLGKFSDDPKKAVAKAIKYILGKI